MKLFRCLFLIGLSLVCALPSLGQAQTVPTTCQEMWRKHTGFTPECFKEGFNGRPISALVLITQTSDHGWSGFGEIYSLVNGDVRIVASSPLTTSRYGRFPEMFSLLGEYQTGVGELKLDGFAMMPANGFSLTNGHPVNVPGHVALHAAIGDGNDNPSEYSGGVNYVSPKNPQNKGSQYCFRWAVNWLNASKQVRYAQQQGQVIWMITHHKKP